MAAVLDTGGDLEQFLGLKVLGRLGVAAVVIAAVVIGLLVLGPPLWAWLGL